MMTIDEAQALVKKLIQERLESADGVQNIDASQGDELFVDYDDGEDAVLFVVRWELA